MSVITGARFLPCGDSALVIEFGDTIDRAINDRVLALASVVRDLDAGIVETVPTFRSLLVQYDPLRTTAADIETAVRGLTETRASSTKPRRLWRLPACYEIALAPDLEEVASRAKISTAEVVTLHSQTQFHVYVVGFAPGYAYMGDLPDVLAFPRRTDPRVRVPAGSVGIALTLTGVYPHESPGGWHLIARCPVRFFDPTLPEPSLFVPGDAVRFDSVSAQEYETIAADVAKGAYRPACEMLA